MPLHRCAYVELLRGYDKDILTNTLRIAVEGWLLAPRQSEVAIKERMQSLLVSHGEVECLLVAGDDEHLTHTIQQHSRVPQDSQGRGEHHPGIRADDVMETCLLALGCAGDDLFFPRDDRTQTGDRFQRTTFRLRLDFICIVSTTIHHDAANRERLRGMGKINIRGRSVPFVSGHHGAVYEPTVADSGREQNLNQETSR